MAKLKLIENGVKKVANKKKRSRRRNTTVTATTKVVANKKRRRRNPLTEASVKSYAAKNGLKVVKKTSNGTIKKVSNKKRGKRRHRRNGVAGMFSKQNGVFGNTKETVGAVISLLAGLSVTRIESSVAAPLLARLLNPLGLGNFAKPAAEAGLSVTINKWAADAIGRKTRTPQAGKFVMIGGLAMAGMSLIELLLPQTSAYNPFASVNVMPISLGAGQQQAAVSAPALAALAASKGVSPATMGSMIRMRQGTGYRRPRIVSY